MAKSKRGGPPKGWKQAEYDLFKRQVANYNKRVRALRKRTRPELLKFAPEPTTVKGLLASQGKREAKRTAKALEQFRESGLQWTMYQGQPMLKAQKAIIERNLERENKRRRQLAKKVKEAFSLENVMVFGNLDTKISKLAVVPGSGRSMISEAKSTGADVFLTGDIGHHEGLDPDDMGMCVIDAGHYGLEQVFIDDMKDLIRTHFSDMNVITYKAGSPYKVV